MEQESVCTLGYHSQTQWLIEPQIILLYDKVEMNSDVYEMIIARGEARRSTLDRILAELLLEYQAKDIIVLKDYEENITPDDAELLDQLIAYWEESQPEGFRELAVALLSARNEHLRHKRRYLEIAEPLYQEMLDQIKVREGHLSSLRAGRMPQEAREGVRHCLEHVLLTGKLTGTLPVFEWQGYSKLREWLSSVPSIPAFAAPLLPNSLLSERITEAMALKVYVELFIGASTTLDEKQLDSILRKRQHLKGAREEIRRMNREVWEFVNTQAQQPSTDVLTDFRETLQERVERLHEYYEGVQLEGQVVQKQPLSRIVMGVASWVISWASLLAPIPGKADELLDQTGQWLSKGAMTKKYPQVAWCYTFQEYGKLFSESLLKRRNRSVSVEIHQESGEDELRENTFCQILGISRRTLYDWQRKGLLPEPARSWQGYKVYSSRHIEAGRKLIS